MYLSYQRATLVSREKLSPESVVSPEAINICFYIFALMVREYKETKRIQMLLLAMMDII